MSLRLTAILTALWISLTAQAERADRPNVIVIMADDIGAEGLACYGSTIYTCLLYTSPSPRDGLLSRMPSSA